MYPVARNSFDVSRFITFERVTGAISIAGTVLAVVALAGVMGTFGHMIFGALAAIALVAIAFTYFFREVQNAFQARQIALASDEADNVIPEGTPDLEALDVVPEGSPEAAARP